MKTKTVKVEIPDSILSELTAVADACGQPLSEVILQCVRSGLPPSLSKVPGDFHQELLDLNRLDDKALMRVAEGVEPSQAKPDPVKTKADFELLRRTYALSLLRWRGHPIPNPPDSLLTS